MIALVHAAVSAAGYLADGGDSPSDIDPTTGKGPEWGEAAPIGLLVIVLLCVALYFLVKSMNRNIKKVPGSFATVGGPSVAAEAGSTPDLTKTDAEAADSTGSDPPAAR